MIQCAAFSGYHRVVQESLRFGSSAGSGVSYIIYSKDLVTLGIQKCDSPSSPLTPKFRVGMW